MRQEHRLELMGSPGSPYTRKMLALLRYRHIAHNIVWGGYHNPPMGYPEPKVKLVPTFFFPTDDGSVEPVVDSTPIARRLEQEYEGRSAIPADPELAFYNELIEDYADEWLTKAMFHYRWYHEADRNNAGPMIAFWSGSVRSDDEAGAFVEHFTQRQYDRLYVVGSNDVTADTIENSYTRFIDILDDLLQKRGFVLGARPSTADFAIYGQFSQLAYVEPTPAAILANRSHRVRAWLDQMEDLSGLKPDLKDWFTAEEARIALKPLLAEIGRVYSPFLLANANAHALGQTSFETEIDGRPWKQPTFPYQAKCLANLRVVYDDLPDALKTTVESTLADTGCERLFI